MTLSRTILLAGVALLGATPAFAYDEAYSGTRLEMRLSSQENDMRALNGRLEQLEFSLRRIEDALQRMQADVDTRIMRLEASESATASAVSALQQREAAKPASTSEHEASSRPPAEVSGSLGALKMQDGKVTGGVNNPKSPPLPDVPPDYGLTSQEQYERAFTLLREAKYAEAEEAFKAFIEKNPKDRLIDNAKYWYGETLYVRGMFEEAAVAFADAYQHNTKGAKAPDSLLKLGLSLAALKKIPDACVTFSELKKKYPNASPTIKARAGDERAKLKCPKR